MTSFEIQEQLKNGICNPDLINALFLSIRQDITQDELELLIEKMNAHFDEITDAAFDRGLTQCSWTHQ